MDRAPATGDGPWKAELIDLVRAASGGLLFGVPLLYTMEVWWVGSRTGPERMLVLLAVLFVPLVALHATAGFRTIRDVRLRDAAADAVEAIAVGLVVTAGVLVLLREVTLDTPPMTALGKVLYESIPFCLGTGVARFLLEGDPGLEATATATATGTLRRRRAPATAPPRSPARPPTSGPRPSAPPSSASASPRPTRCR